MFYLIGINGIDLFHVKQITDGRIEYNEKNRKAILYQSRTGSDGDNKQV